MPCTINNNTSNDLSQLENLTQKLVPFAQKQIGFNRPPTINFDDDEKNAANPLGRTAQYDPSSMEIIVFVTGRHIKDILRSIAHELVHHGQNLRGEFSKPISTKLGYAQNDEHLRGMEREAYETGNLCFRDWEDGIKQQLPLYETIYKESLIGGDNMSIKDWKDKELNNLLMDKWGYKPQPEKKIEEGIPTTVVNDYETGEIHFGEDEDDEDGDDEDEESSSQLHLNPQDPEFREKASLSESVQKSSMIHEDLPPSLRGRGAGDDEATKLRDSIADIKSGGGDQATKLRDSIADIKSGNQGSRSGSGCQSSRCMKERLGQLPSDRPAAEPEDVAEERDVVDTIKDIGGVALDILGLGGLFGEDDTAAEVKEKVSKLDPETAQRLKDKIASIKVGQSLPGKVGRLPDAEWTEVSGPGADPGTGTGAVSSGGAALHVDSGAGYLNLWKKLTGVEQGAFQNNWRTFRQYMRMVVGAGQQARPMLRTSVDYRPMLSQAISMSQRGAHVPSKFKGAWKKKKTPKRVDIRAQPGPKSYISPSPWDATPEKEMGEFKGMDYENAASAYEQALERANLAAKTGTTVQGQTAEWWREFASKIAQGTDLEEEQPISQFGEVPGTKSQWQAWLGQP